MKELLYMLQSGTVCVPQSLSDSCNWAIVLECTLLDDVTSSILVLHPFNMNGFAQDKLLAIHSCPAAMQMTSSNQITRQDSSS